MDAALHGQPQRDADDQGGQGEGHRGGGQARRQPVPGRDRAGEARRLLGRGRPDPQGQDGDDGHPSSVGRAAASSAKCQSVTRP
jgi:hypothetical protein